MNYRLIVIENSLKDKSILTTYKILSKTRFEKGTPQESFMYKIAVPQKDMSIVTEFLKQNILHPYYTHLYNEDPHNDTLIVIFEGKIFNTRKSNFVDAIKYGISHGVTREQMDIKPRNIQEEYW